VRAQCNTLKPRRCDALIRARIPKSPKAWLIGVARHKAIDRLRREAVRKDNERAAAQELGRVVVPLDQLSMFDEQLALVFMCCHPALDPTV